MKDSNNNSIVKPFKLTLEDSNGNKAFITIRAKDVDEAIQKVRVEYHPECTLKVYPSDVETV